MSGRSAGSSLSYRGRQCRYKNIYFLIGRGTKSKALVPRKDRRAMARNHLDRSDVTQIKLTFVDSGQNNKDRIMIVGTDWNIHKKNILVKKNLQEDYLGKQNRMRSD